MRNVFYGFLLSGCSLLGQAILDDSAVIGKLNATLTEMQSTGKDRLSLTRQLTDAMMSIGEANRQPSRRTVEGFADEFVKALIGKNVTQAQTDMLERSIIEALRGLTTNLNSASHLQ